MEVKKVEKENEEEIQPWMSENAINLIKSYLKKDFIFFEWGAGGSTIEFSKHFKEGYSVEHDFEWYNKVKDKIKKRKNIKLYYIPPNTRDLKWFPVFEEGKFFNFKNYVKFVHNIGILGKKFDIVLVDGRARVDCAIEVLPYLSEDAVVFIHDFERQYYWKILKYYEVIDVVDNLIALKKKESVVDIGGKDRVF